jgi:hypothetical protein
VRFGYSKRVSHLVAVGVDVPEDAIRAALCGESVRVGPPEELRLGQIPECLECWEQFSARTIAEAAREATTDAGDRPLARGAATRCRAAIHQAES